MKTTKPKQIKKVIKPIKYKANSIPKAPKGYQYGMESGLLEKK